MNVYILVAILAFGLIIAIHEFGHFIAAKLLGVKVNEFAIGFGPKLLSKQGKETMYSLRLLPLGGFCAMEDEDGSAAQSAMEAQDKPKTNVGPAADSDTPTEQESVESAAAKQGSETATVPRSRAFSAQPRWRRIVILAAGGFANFVAAFLIIVVLTSGARSFGGTTLVGFLDGFPNEGPEGLMVGDTLVSINGERLYYSRDFTFFMQFAQGGRVDLVIRRDGERIELNQFPMAQREFVINGETDLRFGLYFNTIEATAIEQLKFSGYQAMSFVRMIRIGFAQLISGAIGLPEMSGPVGIIDAMNTVAQEAPTTMAAIHSIVFFMAFIGINVAVINLLPIPAMDGGRILFIFITWFVEKVTRRQLNPKYERYINTAAFMLLIGFMIFIMYNDVTKLIS